MSLFNWLKRRRQIDEDVAQEIRSHLAMAVRERVAEGADPRMAHHQAVKEFGNVTLAIEDGRRIWSSRLIDAVSDLGKDVRYAVHVLAKSPGFSLIVIGVLALGIGMNAAVFTLFKSLALKPLAGVEGSGKLAVVLAKTSGGRTRLLSYPDYQYLSEHDHAFAGLTASCPLGASLGLGRGAEHVWTELVTGNYFQVFGVRAQLGRTLLPSDEAAPGKNPVAVLSNGLWRRAFGGDPNILGKTIHLNGYPLTVVGVTEASFHGTILSWDVGVFVPIMMEPQVGPDFRAQPAELLHDRKTAELIGYARLRPGVTLAAAAAQTAVLSTQLTADAPAEDFSQRLMVLPIWRSPAGAQTYLLPAVIMVGAMGVLLLFVVCANLAGLVLVRGVSRRGEIAARLALGASRTRVVRLLLAENLVLTIPGTAAGLLLAWRLVPWLWSKVTANRPGLFFDMSVDGLVIGFAVVAGGACLLLFGFFPALRTSRVELGSVMKDGLSARASAKGRFRTALVVAQVAVSLLLLVASALLGRSLDAAQHANTGFDAHHVISVAMNLNPNGYDEARGLVFYQRLLDNARAGAGVESASLAAIYPMVFVDGAGHKVTVEGYHPRRDEDLVFRYNPVTPGYFRTLRIGIEAGREFARRDDRTEPPVAIVNDTFARRFWGSPRNAIGRRLRVESGEWRTIVGVARDIKYARINEDPRPYIYLPFLQAYEPGMILHVRGSAPLAALIEQARQQVRELDPDLPILEAKTLGEQTGHALLVFLLTARMLMVLGIAAMGLAGMGIYGLVSYTAKQSTQEIGIRMALGANQGAVIRRFLWRGLRLGTMGAAIGIAAASAVTRLLRSLLYGVSATDPVSFAAALVLVLVCVLAATVVPAWRAARTDPMAALRYQ